MQFNGRKTIAAAAGTAAVCVLASMLTGCTAPRPTDTATILHPTEPRGDSAATPWTGLAANDAAEDFHFVVVSDRTGHHRPGVFRDAMGRINLLEPAFVVSVGDLIEGYTDDPKRLQTEWDEIEGYVANLRQPFFYAAGNHDMSNEVMAKTWQRRFGPSWYSFEYKDVLFLVLNSETFAMVHDPRNGVPGPFTHADQMAWIEKTLKDNPSPRWTVVLIHQPLWDSKRVHGDWQKVETWLADRPHTVFAGHHHTYVKHQRNDASYITLATTGGGSPMRGASYGEFDQVAFVTMTEDGPVIANLDLEGIHDENLLTLGDRQTRAALASAVRPRAFRQDSSTFESGTASFDVTNTGSKPMQLAAASDGGPSMVASPGRFETTLAPGASTTVEIAMHSREPEGVDLRSLDAGAVHWTLETETPAGKPLRLDTSHALLPESALAIPQRSDPVTVDGRLDEWPELPLGSATFAEAEHGEQHAGENDARLAFAVERDATHLYVAVRVEDDVRITDPEKIARDQDGLRLELDGRPDPERSANQDLFSAIRAGEFSQLILATVALGDTAEDQAMQRFVVPKESDLRHAVETTDGSYTVEFALPLAELDAMQGGRWEALRLNLIVMDSDAADESPTVLYWRPNRYGDHSIPASGTFRR